MYNYKSVPFGFVVLFYEFNFRNLRATIRSIKGLCPNSPIKIVIPYDTSEHIRKEASGFAPVVVGKMTHTSLINIGVKNSESDWNFILYSGSNLKYRFFHKYSYFLEDEKDILFPIVDSKYKFFEATLNGLFLNKKFFSKVGDFEEDEIYLSKLDWEDRAIRLGGKFKALMGVRII